MSLQNIIKEESKLFDKMLEVKSDNDELYAKGGIEEWLKTNSDKHLFEDMVYGEPMLDLSEDKVKKFIASRSTAAYNKGREDAQEEGERYGMKVLNAYKEALRKRVEGKRLKIPPFTHDGKNIDMKELEARTAYNCALDDVLREIGI